MRKLTTIDTDSRIMQGGRKMIKFKGLKNELGGRSLYGTKETTGLVGEARVVKEVTSRILQVDYVT